jgi:Holliday junction resolvase RusA-like endonuclease
MVAMRANNGLVGLYIIPLLRPELWDMTDPERIPVAPIAKPRMTQRDKWKKTKRVSQYHAYKDLLRLKHKTDLSEMQILAITFYLPMPRSWPERKKKEMEHTFHRQTPDIDNLVKGFLDAACEDDAHIAGVAALKIWSREGAIEYYAFRKKDIAESNRTEPTSL